MKVIVDVSFVASACILSFLFLHTLAGVREGTVAAALMVGTIARQINRLLQPLSEKLRAVPTLEEPVS